MNIIFAVALLTCVYMVRYEYPAVLDEPAVIGWVLQDTPAAKAGIQAGDRIVRIDGIENPTWEQVIPREALNPNQQLDITIERAGQMLRLIVAPEPYGPNQMGSAGWSPREPNFIITDLEPGMPAEQAGMELGDQIVSVDGQPIPGIEAMIDSLKRTKDKPVQIAVLRNGQALTFTVKPVLSNIRGDERYRVGFASAPMKVSSLSLPEAFRRSLEQNKQGSLLILELVQKMVQHKISIRSIEGPIGIGRAAGQAASKKGWTPLLELTAGISLNLGIFNLLPIPIMDGGVILLLFVESLIRRDISLKIKERIYQAAFVFLVLFAVMVIYNDVAKMLPGLMQRMP
jgi:regulator of sigma E protease